MSQEFAKRDGGPADGEAEGILQLCDAQETQLRAGKELLPKANNPVRKDLGLEEDFRDISEYDTHCAELMNVAVS